MDSTITRSPCSLNLWLEEHHQDSMEVHYELWKPRSTGGGPKMRRIFSLHEKHATRDNDKKSILAVQTVRNTIMGSTLMATTSILLCSGLAAVISSTYSVKKPLADSVFGAHGEFMVSLKYVALLVCFLLAFFLYSLSIGFINHFNFLVNTPCAEEESSFEYVCDLLEKGLVLNSVGNRVFYSALPLLLWIFGPVLVFLCSLIMIPVMYTLDVVNINGEGKGRVNLEV